jgi:hypothetical protein
MPKRVLLNILTIVLLGTTQPLSGQIATKPSVQMTSVELAHLVSLRVTVFSHDKDLLVPYCGGGDDKPEYLCVLPSYLEVQTSKGWRRMKLRHGGVMGLVPLDRRKVQLIPSGKSQDFSFNFRTEDFEIEHGQRFRVVVTAWPDEQSMRADEPPIRLASQSFQCP